MVLDDAGIGTVKTPTNPWITSSWTLGQHMSGCVQCIGTHQELALVKILSLVEIETLAELKHATEKVLVPDKTRVEHANVMASGFVAVDALRETSRDIPVRVRRKVERATGQNLGECRAGMLVDGGLRCRRHVRAVAIWKGAIATGAGQRVTRQRGSRRTSRLSD